MKSIGIIEDISIDYKTQKPKILITLNERESLSSLEELKEDKLSIEIKKEISPNQLDKNFVILDKYGITHEGIVLCMNDTLKPINKCCWLCPIWYI